MDGTKRAKRLDRITIARLDAAVICCADAEVKEPYEALLHKLSQSGMTVTFSQLEHAVERLGLRWRNCFTPVTRLVRRNSGTDTGTAEESANTTGTQTVLNRIEGLEQTLTVNGLAQYKALHHRGQEQAQLAKERAEAIQADMKKMMEWTQTLASVAGKVSRMENWLFSVFLHVVPQSNPSEKEAQQ